MADININPLNVSGLAALAGNRIGNLDLPVADWGKYPAMYSEMINRQQIAQMMAQSELQRQGMANQGAFNVAGLQADKAMALQQASQNFQGNQNQQDRNLQAQKLAQEGLFQNADLNLRNTQLQQQGQYQQGQLGIDQQRVMNEQQASQNLNDFHNGILQLRHTQQELLSRSKLDEEDRNQRGAASSMVLSWMNTHDPSTWAQGLPPVIDMLHKEGIYTDAEYQQIQNLPPQALHDIAVHDILLNSKADDVSKNPILQNALGLAVKGQKGTLSSAAEAKAEQQAMSNINVANQAQTLSSNIKNNPEAFTALGGAAAGASNFAGRFPVLAPAVNAVFNLMGEDPKAAEEAKTNIDSQTTSMWGDIAKNLSPFLLRAANSDYKNKLIPNTDTDGPAKALQKAQALDQIVQAKQILDQQFMHNGVIQNQSEYDKAMQNILNKGVQATSPIHNGRTVDMDKIMQNMDTILKMNPGMTKEQVLQQLGDQ